MENALGYKWILMEKLPGETYRSVNADGRLGLDNRLSVSRTVAEWEDELSRVRLNSIGSFFITDDPNRFKLGRPVLQHFMGDSRHDYHHRRGPFNNLHIYLRSFLDCSGAELFDHRQRLRAEIDVLDDEIRRLEKNLKCKSNHIDAGKIKARLRQLKEDYSTVLESQDVIDNAGVDFQSF